jgi:hypothetical protein
VKTTATKADEKSSEEQKGGAHANEKSSHKQNASEHATIETKPEELYFLSVSSIYIWQVKKVLCGMLKIRRIDVIITLDS